MLYNSRARIGYCSPPFVTEIFCYEFYKMVPDGVTLMITTLDITTRSKQEIESSHAKSLAAAKYMAGAGADVVVLGGNPINQSRGVENLDAMCEELAAEIGTKVVTSTQAQIAALRALGSRKVAQVQCYEAEHNPRHEQSIRNMGFEPAGVEACGYSFQDLGRVPPELALTLSRKVKEENPQADTIHMSSAHWPCGWAIEQIERELGVSVMTSHQAIVWKALRTAGIADPIAGFGRLLREF